MIKQKYSISVCIVFLLLQMNGLCIEEEQDISNLKRECEEKEATIRELTEFLHSSDAAGSKANKFLPSSINNKYCEKKIVFSTKVSVFALLLINFRGFQSSKI